MAVKSWWPMHWASKVGLYGREEEKVMTDDELVEKMECSAFGAPPTMREALTAVRPYIERQILVDQIAWTPGAWEKGQRDEATSAQEDIKDFASDLGIDL